MSELSVAKSTYTYRSCRSSQPRKLKIQQVMSLFQNLRSVITHPWHSLWKNRYLLFQLCLHATHARYKGAIFGMVWAMLLPLLMLAIYAFVFGEIFHSRWGGNTRDHLTQPDRLEFALILYAGLITFNWFSEIFSKSTTVCANNVNFIKKVLFPVDILPIIPVLVGAFHFGMSLVVLFIFLFFSSFTFSYTWLLIPIYIFPFVLFLMGIAWIFSALSVFLKDLEQVAPALISALMFLSPVFYSSQALPEFIRPWLNINPLTHFIELFREILFWKTFPDLTYFLNLNAIALLFFYLGHRFFCFLRKGFADVL